MPSRTDTAGHNKALDYPVMEHLGGKTEVFSSASGTRTYNASAHSQRTNTLSHPSSTENGSVCSGADPGILEKGWGRNLERGVGGPPQNKMENRMPIKRFPGIWD